MRFGFVTEEEDAEVVDLGTGMVVVDEDPEYDEETNPLVYLSFQIMGRMMEWRIR